VQHGDSGERVREVQERLRDVGHDIKKDPSGVFGDATKVSVEAFQRSRGLQITGKVDSTTWSRLIEAGWLLGQRLLFHTHPNMRGDDVAQLQVHLAQLGFNPGQIDGIFGPLLESALTDFQNNVGITASATLTRETLNELQRMTVAASVRNLVNEARDNAGFDDVLSGQVVLCGNGQLLELVHGKTTQKFDVINLGITPPSEIAAHANDNGAAVVLSFQHNEELAGIHLHYWASYRSHSRKGEQLASVVAASISRSPLLPRVEVTGMALPILRETRMTTLHIEHGVLEDGSLAELAELLVGILNGIIQK
jgi:N-acetylmuramoyl-L-alanine amidase